MIESDHGLMGLKLLIENDLKCAEVIAAFPDSLEIFLELGCRDKF